MTTNRSPTPVPIIDDVEVFCHHYLKNFDAVEAYKLTFPDKEVKDINKSAWQYRRGKKVEQRLVELSKRLMRDMDEEVRELIEQTKNIAAFSWIDVMEINESGEPEINLKKCMQNPDIMRVLDIEFGVAIDKDGGRHRVYKVKAQDKMAALEKLYKYYKLYNAESNVNARTPIHVNVTFPIPGGGWRNSEHDEPDIIDVEDAQV